VKSWKWYRDRDAAIALNKLTKKLLTANYYRIKLYHILVTVVSIHLIYTIKRNLKSMGSSLACSIGPCYDSKCTYS
jgi:hypothetical protein